LKNGFGLYDPEHLVKVHIGDQISVLYSSSPDNRRCRVDGVEAEFQIVNNRFCSISGLFIDSTYRRGSEPGSGGNGTALVRSVEEFVFGFFGIREFVTTPSGLSKQYGFWQSCGYRNFGEWEVRKQI
tara:strand:+ start:230 stop:610 length:381 start_codon:yes stop_codon:yes gene_type:complete